MAQDSNQRVLFEVKDHIAYVSLNRPEKHNGLDLPLFRQLIDTAKKIKKNKDIRAVILSGEGPSFCAGLDFKAVSKTPSMIPKLFLKLPWAQWNDFQKVALIWRNIPVPVITAIHGNCFGGGLQIALGSDYRIARADSKLSVMEIKWGLIPDMSGTVTLTTLTRYDIAQELTMTGRVFSGEEAHEYGIVSKLSDDPMADAKQLAESIAEKSPDAIAATKFLFRKTWKADPLVALLWERWTQMRLLGRKNQRTALKNGLSGKSNPFSNRSSF
jgi:enoyl-CoA hydratase/carnithine racemase